MTHLEPNRLVRTALFVDFDNIFLRLKEVDEAAAKQFATNPGLWLKWMVSGMVEDETATSVPGPTRAVLMRRCYLNPHTFSEYRPYFTRSAFSVVDCPSLTARGKSSTDIHMIMDILDALNHATHFDEFIILSGDADFTPVLLRLRNYDRRTAILAIGPAAEAYKSACDSVINVDTFIERGLGLKYDAAEVSRGTVDAAQSGIVDGQLLQTMSDALFSAAVAADGLYATDLPPIYRQFPQFARNGNWLGFYGLRPLTMHLVSMRSDLILVEAEPSWMVQVVQQAPPEGGSAPQDSSATIPEPVQARDIVEFVDSLVRNSDEPIVMAIAAHAVIQKFGEKATTGTDWLGKGTFKTLLERTDGHEFVVFTEAGSPGYLLIPAKHSLSMIPTPMDRLEGLDPVLADFIRRVSRVTGAPALTPSQYALLFESLAEELAAHPYNITSTARGTRDRTIEKGDAIGRGDISFVLHGVSYQGYGLRSVPPDDAAVALAETFARNVVSLCVGAQMELTTEERQLLDLWIRRGLLDNHARGEPPAE